MTSDERKEVRYQRRKEFREKQRMAFQEKYASFENITDFDNLVDAFLKTRKSVSWKYSIQNFDASLFRNIFVVIKRLENAEYVIDPTHNFYITERGKTRFIQSVNIKERVIQRVICDQCLVPITSHYLIYDNGASLKRKGPAFSLKRLDTHIHRFYRHYGRDGYILLIDFSKYFERILHAPVIEMVSKLYIDQRIKDAIIAFVDRFGDDSGLGLGGQICQILAVYYLNEIEHYIKDTLGIKYYGRYMDDSYFIFQTKEECYQMIELLIPLYERLGIKMNMKKTQIVNLKHQFTYLKVKIQITETGEIVKMISPQTIKTMRRKLKKFRRFVDEGLMGIEEVVESYNSWRGHVSKRRSYRTVKEMDILFDSLFPETSSNNISSV